MKIKFQILLSIILFLLLDHNHVQARDLNYDEITPFNTSSGLVFQHFGSTQTYTSSYNLLTYHNLTHIHKVNVAKTYYALSSNLCILATSAHIFTECNNQLRYLENKINSIKQSFRIIYHQLNIVRQKRGK